MNQSTSTTKPRWLTILLIMCIAGSFLWRITQFSAFAQSTEQCTTNIILLIDNSSSTENDVEDLRIRFARFIANYLSQLNDPRICVGAISFMNHDTDNGNQTTLVKPKSITDWQEEDFNTIVSNPASEESGEHTWFNAAIKATINELSPLAAYALKVEVLIFTDGNVPSKFLEDRGKGFHIDEITEELDKLHDLYSELPNNAQVHVRMFSTDPIIDDDSIWLDPRLNTRIDHNIITNEFLSESYSYFANDLMGSDFFESSEIAVGTSFNVDIPPYREWTCFTILTDKPITPSFSLDNTNISPTVRMDESEAYGDCHYFFEYPSWGNWLVEFPEETIVFYSQIWDASDIEIKLTSIDTQYKENGFIFEADVLMDGNEITPTSMFTVTASVILANGNRELIYLQPDIAKDGYVGEIAPERLELREYPVLLEVSGPDDFYDSMNVTVSVRAEPQVQLVSPDIQLKQDGLLIEAIVLLDGNIVTPTSDFEVSASVSFPNGHTELIPVEPDMTKGIYHGLIASDRIDLHDYPIVLMVSDSDDEVTGVISIKRLPKFENVVLSSDSVFAGEQISLSFQIENYESLNKEEVWVTLLDSNGDMVALESSVRGRDGMFEMTLPSELPVDSYIVEIDLPSENVMGGFVVEGVKRPLRIFPLPLPTPVPAIPSINDHPNTIREANNRAALSTLAVFTLAILGIGYTYKKFKKKLQESESRLLSRDKQFSDQLKENKLALERNQTQFSIEIEDLNNRLSRTETERDEKSRALLASQEQKEQLYLESQRQLDDDAKEMIRLYQDAKNQLETDPVRARSLLVTSLEVADRQKSEDRISIAISNNAQNSLTMLLTFPNIELSESRNIICQWANSQALSIQDALAKVLFTRWFQNTEWFISESYGLLRENKPSDVLRILAETVPVGSSYDDPGKAFIISKVCGLLYELSQVDESLAVPDLKLKLQKAQRLFQQASEIDIEYASSLQHLYNALYQLSNIFALVLWPPDEAFNQWQQLTHTCSLATPSIQHEEAFDPRGIVDAFRICPFNEIRKHLEVFQEQIDRYPSVEKQTLQVLTNHWLDTLVDLRESGYPEADLHIELAPPLSLSKPESNKWTLVVKNNGAGSAYNLRIDTPSGTKLLNIESLNTREIAVLRSGEVHIVSFFVRPFEGNGGEFALQIDYFDALAYKNTDKKLYIPQKAGTKPSGRMSNPYVYNRPLELRDDPKLLLEREEHISALYQNINRNVISVSGLRQVGKSSLLLKGVISELKERGHLPIYFDMARWQRAELRAKAKWTESTILTIIAQEIFEQSGHERKSLELPSQMNLSEFVKSISSIWNRKEQLLVLIFDEADLFFVGDDQSGFSTRHTRDSLIDNLNTFLKENNVTLIFAHDPSMELLWSNFNIKPIPIWVKLLSNEAVEALFYQFIDERYFSPLAIEYIWRMSGGYPLLTQLFAHTLWERCLHKASWPVFLDDVVSIARSLIENKDYWKFYEYLEYNFVSEKGMLQDIAPPEKRLLQDLIQDVDSITMRVKEIKVGEGRDFTRTDASHIKKRYEGNGDTYAFNDLLASLIKKEILVKTDKHLLFRVGFIKLWYEFKLENREEYDNVAISL